MFNDILKSIQVILFMIIFTPGIILCIETCFIKDKKFKKSRFITGSFAILISSLMMFILSIFIVNDNSLYINCNYPVFQQLWVVTKSMLLIYLYCILIMFIINGIFVTFIMITNKIRVKKYKLLNKNIKFNKLTLFEKIIYCNLFYETKVNCIEIEGNILLSQVAIKEYEKYKQRRIRKYKRDLK